MTRDHLFPLAAMITIFAVTILLVLAGHSDSLERHAQSITVEPKNSHRISRIHRVVTGRVSADAAARALCGDRGLSSVVSYLAFRVLLELSEEETAMGILLDRGSFWRGNRLVSGLEEASNLIFGSGTEFLTDAELALFCHWTVHGQASWDPDDLIATRQRLLYRLVRRNVINQETYTHLAAQPLALRPIPVPIY